MKIKLLTVLLICLLAAGAAAARRQKISAEPETDWSKELDLDEAQNAQLKAIYEESHDKVLSMIQQIETLHKEIADIKENNEVKLREILTEKQKIKFDKIKMRQQKAESGNSERWKGKNKPSRKRMRQY